MELARQHDNSMKGLSAIEILILIAILVLLGVVVIPRLLEALGG
jgi:Tfp pilus assembly protein FimT